MNTPLQSAITKWQEVVKDPLGINISASCPLCEAYRTYKKNPCIACPVFERTKKPYIEFVNKKAELIESYINNQVVKDSDLKKLKRLAKNYLNLLKSL